jgi:hypothetical protein
MNRIPCVLALCIAVSITNRVLGGEGQTQEVLRAAVDLLDGSHIVGIPALASVPLQTPYAKMEIPLKQMARIVIDKDHENASFDLANGDKLKGVFPLGKLELRTLFGKVSVGVEQLAAIRFFSGGQFDRLVLHYTFDGDEGGKVRDESGHGHDGYLVGAVQYEDALKGKGVRFTAPGTYIVSAAEGLNVKGWPELTLSIWVKIRRFTTSGSVMGRGEVTGEKSGGFGIGFGGVYGGKWNASGFGVNTRADGGFSVTPRTFAAGVTPYPALEQWYHLAGTYDGTAVRYYVNGNLDGEAKCADTGQPLWDDPASKLVIGTCPRKPFIDWSDQYVDGLMDEVMIFDRALPENDIRQLYDSQK